MLGRLIAVETIFTAVHAYPSRSCGAACFVFVRSSCHGTYVRRRFGGNPHRLDPIGRAPARGRARPVAPRDGARLGQRVVPNTALVEPPSFAHKPTQERPKRSNLDCSRASRLELGEAHHPPVLVLALAPQVTVPLRDIAPVVDPKFPFAPH